MNVYILIEGPDMGMPDTMDKIILGVFSAQERATECLEHHARYIAAQEGREPIRDAQKLKDEHGNVYMEVIERELDCCRPETWI